MNPVPTRRHWLDHRVPPPLIGLLSAALMAGLARYGPVLPLADMARHALTGVLLVAGIGLDLSGLMAFRAAHTTLNPLRPRKAAALVTSGIYRFTRNPMYLGMLLLLLAWGVHLASLWAFAVLPVFVLYLGRFQIAPEEAAMLSLFGDDYQRYAARVRRWL